MTTVKVRLVPANTVEYKAVLDCPICDETVEDGNDFADHVYREHAEYLVEQYIDSLTFEEQEAL